MLDVDIVCCNDHHNGDLHGFTQPQMAQMDKCWDLTLAVPKLAKMFGRLAIRTKSTRLGPPSVL